MKVRLAHHTYKRLVQNRQNGITVGDVYRAARNIPGKLPKSGYRVKYNKANSGRLFDLIIADCNGYRKVITVIGL